MALLLGIDTGGTYTDAALLDEHMTVLAAAKSPTTRHDLKLGIGAAIDAVFTTSNCAPADVAMVSLSTTLATNALVEGQGGGIALVLAGFPANARTKGGLQDALKDDPCIEISGGHDACGHAAQELDLETLTHAVRALPAGVQAIAVASLFAVRNPDHETAIRAQIRILTDLPVTCSHELSSELDAPRRAMTTVLNARLVSLIHRLIADTREKLQALNIDAQLMIVRGDGALMSAEVATLRPIETILSGPAASLVGAAHLSGLANAVVSDIGGTTTDVGVLRDGRPRLAITGASVGGFQTMIEAVDMVTIGLGGDSEVRLIPGAGLGGLTLGPRRVIPLAAFCGTNSELVQTTLKRQLASSTLPESAGRFAVLRASTETYAAHASNAEKDIIARLTTGPEAVDRLVSTRLHLGALDRLVGRGTVLLSALSPTDAAHALEFQHTGNREVALLGLDLFARQKDNRGKPLAADKLAVAERIFEAMHDRGTEVLLEVALRGAGSGRQSGSDASTKHDRNISQDIRFLADRAKHDYPSDLLRIEPTLAYPLVGLGASAGLYYPPIAQRLRTQLVNPQYADVANAIGAVVGRVSVTLKARIVEEQGDGYQVFFDGEPKVHADYAAAMAHARSILSSAAIERANTAGAIDVTLQFELTENRATVDGRNLLIEAELSVTATGRPSFAS